MGRREKERPNDAHGHHCFPTPHAPIIKACVPHLEATQMPLCVFLMKDMTVQSIST